MSNTSELKSNSRERFETLFTPDRPLVLDSGDVLVHVDVAYETWGSLEPDRSNAVLVCHALTANAHAGSNMGEEDGWWSPLIGPGKALDTDRYYVICPNILGSCYGTTGPTKLDPTSGLPFGPEFPEISIRDMVRVHRALLDRLEIRRLETIIGSSLGGMQVLEWGVMYPELSRTLIPISVGAQQSAWCLALNAIARGAITGDPAWFGGRYRQQPRDGLTLARMVGMVSYRSPEEFEQRFGRAVAGPAPFGPGTVFEVERYLRYQGQKLADRFDANSYLTLSRAMDRHDVGAGRGGVESALSSIIAPTFCIGVSSDLRYPVGEQEELVRMIPEATLAAIDSIHGHDAFLIEFEQLSECIRGFMSGATASREEAA